MEFIHDVRDGAPGTGFDRAGMVIHMTYDEMKRALDMTDDAALKLEMLMDFGAHMDAVPAAAVCTEIAGCSSRAAICRDGNRFYGDADSAIVRGVVALLTAMVDGHTAEEIKNMDLAAEFESLGLQLGAGRLNGVNSMIRFLHNL